MVNIYISISYFFVLLVLVELMTSSSTICVYIVNAVHIYGKDLVILIAYIYIKCYISEITFLLQQTTMLLIYLSETRLKHTRCFIRVTWTFLMVEWFGHMT